MNAEFASCYNRGQGQILTHRIPKAAETTTSASLKLKDKYENFFLLESVEAGNKRGRYSLIALDPDLIWKCETDTAAISKNGEAFVQETSDPISSLRALHHACQFPLPKGVPSMASALVGYLSYDAIRLSEPTVPDNNPDSIGTPLGMFMRPRVSLVFDELEDNILISSNIFPQEGIPAEEAYRKGQKRIDNIIKQLQQPTPQPPAYDTDFTADFTPNMRREEFHNMVEKAKDYIMAGDIFQVVPSQRFTSHFPLPPFSFYQSLRHLNPSPFLFFLQLKGFHLIGSSPEILVRVRDNKVTIRPLAGTRKRGKNAEEDKRLAADLLSDEKELSEHLMLIDLSRNDVGRVSLPGTVKVTEQMVIEYYSHVMHISSNVEGTLDTSKHDALSALLSGLPVGTVSGAPKVRAMQIIDELEPEKRSFYAGCVGYFSADGSMDTCITLRTGLIKDQTLYLQAGGGIVADSDPESEYQESCNKAKALMVAAEKAKAFL